MDLAAYERTKAQQRARYAARKAAGLPGRPYPVKRASEAGKHRDHNRRPRPGERPACGTCTGSGCMDTLAYDCPDCAGTGLLTGAQALAHYELKHQLTIRAKGWLVPNDHAES